MERFVRFVVAGGVTMLAGLWVTEFTESWTAVWLVGWLTAFLGGVAVSWGIWSQVDSGFRLDRWV